MTQFSIHDRPDYEPPEHPDETRAREEAMAERRASDRTSDPTDLRSGGCAFPVERGPESGYSPGMSLRDWFAGQALAGMMNWDGAIECAGDAARWAYEYADAMLAARESEGR